MPEIAFATPIPVTSIVPLLAVLVPAAGTAVIFVLHRHCRLHCGIVCAVAMLQLAASLYCLPAIQQGLVLTYPVLHLLPGLTLEFRADGLSLIPALALPGGWLLLALYTQFFLPTQPERQGRDRSCQALIITAASGVVFAGNLLTLCLCFCLLLLFSCLLMVGKRETGSAGAGRRYPSGLLFSALLSLLPLLLLIYSHTGTLHFSDDISHGILENKAPDALVLLLYVLCMLGFIATGFMLPHGWTSGDLAARLPVTVLIQTLAVGNAGAFATVRVLLSIFGLGTLQRLHLDLATAWFFGGIAVVAAGCALLRSQLPERLTCSTISFLACIIMAAGMASPAAISGGMFLFASHSAAKLTAWFAAGMLLYRNRQTDLSAFAGAGRQAPIIFALFILAVLSLGGIAPLAGFGSLWLMVNGAFAARHAEMIFVLAAVAILHLLAFAPFVHAGFCQPPAGKVAGQGRNAPAVRLLPLMAAGALTLGLGLIPFCLSGAGTALR